MKDEFEHVNSFSFYTFKKKDDFTNLVSLLRTYDLPKNWQTNVHHISVTINSPDRRRSIKVDTYGTVTIDRIRSCGVRSTVKHCGNVEEAWAHAVNKLNKFLKRSINETICASAEGADNTLAEPAR